MQYIPLENNILVQYEVIKNDKFTKILTGTTQEPEFILSSNKCKVIAKGEKVSDNIQIGDKLILSKMRNQSGEIIEIYKLIKSGVIDQVSSNNYEADSGNFIISTKENTEVFGIVSANSITCIVRDDE